MPRTPEQRAWDVFKKESIPARYDLHRIENRVGSGMPDALGINMKGTVFFLELKAIAAWPSRATTAVLNGRFEHRQLSFGRRWNLMGGYSFVLLRVGALYVLLRPLHKEKALDELTKDELMDSAIMVGKEEIVKYLENLK